MAVEIKKQHGALIGIRAGVERRTLGVIGFRRIAVGAEQLARVFNKRSGARFDDIVEIDRSPLMSAR